jgi:hypothetical protein
MSCWAHGEQTTDKIITIIRAVSNRQSACLDITGLKAPTAAGEEFYSIVSHVRILKEKFPFSAQSNLMLSTEHADLQNSTRT